MTMIIKFHLEAKKEFKQAAIRIKKVAIKYFKWLEEKNLKKLKKVNQEKIKRQEKRENKKINNLYLYAFKRIIIYLLNENGITGN